MATLALCTLLPFHTSVEQTMNRIIEVQHDNGELEGICKLCGQRMIWRDMGEHPSVSAGNLVQEDLGGFWEHECDLKVLAERERGLIKYISVNARINGMTSMVEHPKYSLLIAIQDKLYESKEE